MINLEVTHDAEVEMIDSIRLLCLIGALASVDAFAWTHNLVQDLGVKSNLHYCKYSNGKVYTFNATELCKLSIEDSAPGMGQGTGFLAGEYLDGMTKVCIYDVLGEKKALRQSSTSLCPLNPKF